MLNLFKHLNSLFYSLFPDVCIHCKHLLFEGENIVCFKCQLKIINYSFSWVSPQDNSITEKFKFRLPIQKGVSFFIYESNSVVRSLIHELKYKNNEYIGKWIIDHYEYLWDDKFFSDIDLIIPVPLHYKRKLERGYNQVDLFCIYISNKTGVKYEEKAIKKVKNTTSQTTKSREERLNSMNEVFKVIEPSKIKDKHLLLVDDVLTTGATLEALGNTAIECGASKISILTVAYKA